MYASGKSEEQLCHSQGIWASTPHEAPAGEARKDAWNKLNQHLDLVASKVDGAPAEELEELVDEVCDDVRHGRR